ncbi:DUF2835 family protein [Glaciecola sp. 1036]|uniref:DUF2835 family protein n=1 Tax=Alteromonadaceae TaxID=72275 RepID=UPI003D0056AF
MKTFIFDISMNYLECKSLYDHSIKYVVVNDINGKRLQLEKRHILNLLTPSGIKGRYQLTVDANNNFKKLVKID